MAKEDNKKDDVKKDDRQKRSVIASLARKGFCMSDMISVMKETD